MTRMVMWWAAAAVLLAAGLFWRLEVIEAMVEADRPPSGRADGGELYQRLLDLHLITKEGDSLVLPSEDMELHQVLTLGESFEPDSESHQALVELYNPRSRQGKAVRRAVALWNASRAMVAIRDDRQGPPSPDGGPILTGERPNEWTGADSRGRPLLAADIPVPEAFAYVNSRKLHAGFGDWKVFLGGDKAAAIGLSTRLVLDKAATVSLQVIGRLDVAGSTLPANAVIRWRCAKDPCIAGNATAATVILADLFAGSTEVSIKLMPVRAPALPVSGLSLAFSPDQLRQCRAGGPDACAAQCPHWVSLPQTRRRREGQMTIMTADGVPLFQDGHPTDDANRLGLLPVVGFDTRQSWTLVGRLARRQKDREADVTLHLTIDSRAQAAAQAALEATIHERFDERDDDLAYRLRRRAALTVIDPESGAVLAAAQWPRLEPGISTYDLGALAAGDPTRDPLAPAGWSATSPDFTPGSTWKLVIDLAALRMAEGNSKLAAMIRGCKPGADGVLACAGLSLDQQRYLIPGQTCNEKWCGAKNFRSQSRGFETLRQALETPARSPRCAGRQVSPPTSIGMAEALKVSNNIWQVKLAEMIDLPAARAYDEQSRKRTTAHPDLPDLKDSVINETAGLLGLFDDGTDLLAPLADGLGMAGPRNGLALESARSDLYDLSQPSRRQFRPSGALDALGQTAIGQRVSVAPLHLARIAATIRGGNVPVPHLTASLNGVPLSAGTGQPFPVSDLSPLRAGMKAVTESDGGTALEAFGGVESGKMAHTDERSERMKNARCHIFGKTGSGQLPQKETDRPLNAGWFVGWAEAEAFDALASESPPAWRRPVAFACAMSPVHGFIRRDDGTTQWTKTGGSTCAPAVASFLERLDAPASVP